MNPVSFFSQEANLEAILIEEKERLLERQQIIHKKSLEKKAFSDLSAVLETFPSVYNAKSGGTFGYSKTFVHGFGGENNAIYLLGIGINDPFNGSIRWDNLSLLGDFLGKIRFETGMGVLGDNFQSIGGSVFLETVEKSDTFKGYFFHRYHRFERFSNQVFLSIPWKKNQIDLGLSYQNSKGFFVGTQNQTLAYFVQFSHFLSDFSTLQFLVFGAPLKTQIRSSPIRGEIYERSGKNLNLHYGQNKSAREDDYQKPFFIFNYQYLRKNFTFKNQLYYSFGRGFGVLPEFNNNHPGLLNVKNKKIFYNLFANGEINSPYNQNDQVNFEAITSYNQNQSNPFLDFGMLENTEKSALMILRSAYSNQEWLGTKNQFEWAFSPYWQIKMGHLIEYAQGHLYHRVYDFLGADFFYDNRQKDTISDKNKNFLQNYKNLQIDNKIFANIHFEKQKHQFFLVGGIANKTMQREDLFFQKNQTLAKTGWKNRQSYNLKTQYNYLLSQDQNFSINLGFINRSPYFNALFDSKQNYFSFIPNEKIYSAQFSYWLKINKFYLFVNLYGVFWQDRSKSSSTILEGKSVSGYLYGLSQRHLGIDLSLSYKVFNFWELQFSSSLGNWKYEKNAKGIFENNQGEQSTIFFPIKDFFVADAPQMHLVLGQIFNWKSWELGLEAHYYDRHFAQYKIENQEIATTKQKVFKIPSYYLINTYLNFIYSFNSKTGLKIGVFADQITHLDYITEAIDGVNHDLKSSLFFYGSPWSLGLDFHFFF